jgi:p-cumate 2,3-dioxygenase ferredoxin reductase subunit
MSEGINNIVIAGAGQAGATVAFGLRKAGFEGEVTIVGDEAHLPYERPQLSKEMLQAEPGDHRTIKALDDYAAHGIKLELGRRVTEVDAGRRRIALDDARTLDYDGLVIATGVKPRQLPGAFHDPERVRYLRTVEDARQLREDIRAGRSLAIIGGGVIGLEVAASARAAGCRVTVVEAAERLMSRSVDEVVSNYLDRTHRRNGVDLRYGVVATELTPGGFLKLSDGSTVPADRVLVGIGVTPNLTGFEALGITDVAGVRVDGAGRTAVNGIYATGDVASQPNGRGFARVETWANAQDHATNLVKTLLGEDAVYQSPTWFWSDQGPSNLQVVGNAIEGDRVIRGDERGDSFSVFWLDGDRVTGCASVNAPKDMAMARRWVRQGAHVDRGRLADMGVELRGCAV